MRICPLFMLPLFLSALSGCAVIEPGHRGLLFKNGPGLRTQVLSPGRYYVAPQSRVVDFDVTYSTRTEDVQTVSSEGLALKVRCSVMFRPIIAELYDLDVEIGQNYYQEILGPQFRTAMRGIFALHSYSGLERNNAMIEEEIRNEVRRRMSGKHVEIAAVTMEAVNYAPELVSAIRAKVVSAQEAATELHKKQIERTIAEEQARIDKLRSGAEARR